jgi:hypothetical protein
MNKLLVEVREYNSKQTKFYIIEEDTRKSLDENGQIESFMFKDRLIVNSSRDFKVFNVIKDYKVLNSKTSGEYPNYDEAILEIQGQEMLVFVNNDPEQHDKYYFKY